MRAVRSLVAVLVFVVFAAPSVVLADGRVGAGGRQQHLRPHRAAAERGQRHGRHLSGAAAARLRGDDRAGCVSDLVLQTVPPRRSAFQTISSRRPIASHATSSVCSPITDTCPLRHPRQPPCPIRHLSTS